jgi:N-acetyl-anhydromuramyl-L-alanine amidase AmpD
MTALPVETKMADPGDFGSRRNVPVDTLVLHTTEGGAVEGALEHWHREDVTASAHYVIDGEPVLRVVQNVAEGDCAYHAGSRSINRRSIGIEVCGKANDPKTWTPELMVLLVALSADICKRHRIPIVHQPGPGICGHADVPDPYNPNRYGGASHHTDPGPHFPWPQFLDALRAELAKENIA